MSLIVKDLSVVRGGKSVLEAINFEINSGEFVGLIGPNGAGKSTLMRAVLGLVAHSGSSSLMTMAPLARAAHVAWMPQERDINWAISVEDVVALGRTPYRLMGQKQRPEDHDSIEQALAAFGLEALRHQAANALSGGEKARVLIARAVAQATPLLMADEPIAGLDPANQFECMSHFAAHAAAGHAVFAAVHDLGLAAQYCSRLLVLHQGQLVMDAPPAEALGEQTVASVFGVRGGFVARETGAQFQVFSKL